MVVAGRRLLLTGAAVRADSAKPLILAREVDPGSGQSPRWEQSWVWQAEMLPPGGCFKLAAPMSADLAPLLHIPALPCLFHPAAQELLGSHRD